MFLVAQLVRRLPVNLKVGVQIPPGPIILLMEKINLGKFELSLSRNLNISNCSGNSNQDACIANSNVHVVSKILCIPLDEMDILCDEKHLFTKNDMIAHW